MGGASRGTSADFPKPAITSDSQSPNNTAVRSVRLTIAYEGTNYCGWQVQPDQPSVQGTIEQAIETLTGEAVRIHGAGRTDAGVHAIGQVAHFRTDATIPPTRFAPALNGVLPRDIVIRDSAEVAADFHARYSAVRKQYRYLIDVTPQSLPWLRHLVWRLPGEFDVAAFRDAGRCLLGEHDFSSFESKSDPNDNSVRTVSELSVERLTDGLPWPGACELIAVEITADGFLYNMVRSIVGTLVKVAHGQWTAADVSRVLKSGDRSQAGPTAPPQGLSLVRVDYDGADAAPEIVVNEEQAE